MSGNKRDKLDRDSGLTFSWRTPESCAWSTTAAVILVSLLTIGLLGALRVRVVPPPRVIERHAGLMLLPEGPEGRAWAVNVDEQGPFPAKYDPGTDPVIRKMEKQALQLDFPRVPYRPVLRDLPEEPAVPVVNASRRGERIFPKESPPDRVGEAAPVFPLAPVLLPLSNLPASAWPTAYPPFDFPVSPLMAAKTWRYMAEIGPNGRVVRHQPIEVGDDEGAKESILRLGDWIGRLQFGPTAKPGWIAVEVAFNRNP